MVIAHYGEAHIPIATERTVESSRMWMEKNRNTILFILLFI